MAWNSKPTTVLCSLVPVGDNRESGASPERTRHCNPRVFSRFSHCRMVGRPEQMMIGSQETCQ